MSTERHDTAAEKAILGAMMISPTAIIDAEASIKPEAFYDPNHTLIFRAITTLAAQGAPTGPVAIADHLLTTGGLIKIGGGPYLHELMTWAAVPQQVTYYAKIVDGFAQLRALDQAVARASHLISTASHGDATRITEQIIDMFLNTNRETTGDDGPKHWSEYADKVLTTIEERGNRDPNEIDPNAIPSGLTDLDEALGGGAHQGQLLVVAGRPGSGKSVSAMNWAHHAAMNGIPTAVFALEMDAVELGVRWASAATGIDHRTVNSGHLSDGEWTKLARWTGEISQAPLFIDETATLSVGDIRARARRMKQRHDIRLIVVDYLQLVSSERSENRQVAVSAMSRALKLLAKELECAVLLVAQLNRGPEGREDRRPKASDLRESGAIEQDADVVILLHPMEGDSNPRKGETDLIIDKARATCKTTIPVAAQLHMMRFASLAAQ